MNKTQREAALRLADDMDTPISVWADHVAHLLRELASEPVQEPVCWGWRVPDGRITMIFSERKDNPDLEVVPLFTHPPQPEPNPLKGTMADADRYRWLVNHASSFDGTADSDNMVRLWFYRPDKREVMVQGKDLDAAIAAADAERRAILALQRA